MTMDPEFIPTIAVGQFSGDLKGMSAEQANAVFTKLLSDISVDSGKIGIIGHNTANFKCGEDLLSISCTTENGTVRSKIEFSQPVNEFKGVMNVIVYGADFKALEDIIYKYSADVPGMKAEVIEDHGATECHDPNCHDPSHHHHHHCE